MIYVFLDTNLYLRGHSGKELIDPAQDYFPHLVRHAKKGELRLVMPAVTREEIEAQIRIAADRCRETISRLTLPNASVELTPLITRLRAEYDPIGTAEDMQQKISQFWADTDCTELTVTQIDVEKLKCAQHASGDPTAKAGYSAYRYAYILQALEEFQENSTEEDDSVVVISADEAFRAYITELDPDILVCGSLHGLFDLWGQSNQEMLALLNEGIHELELDSRICEELDGFAFALKRGSDLLQFEDLQAAVVRDDAGKQKLRITGYEVIDADSALLSFEGEVALTFTGAVVPQYIYAEDGSVSDVQFRTADISRTVSLSGWTDILGKFAEDDSIDFVEDLNDLEFDTETGGMVIDITDGDADISYYE